MQAGDFDSIVRERTLYELALKGIGRTINSSSLNYSQKEQLIKNIMKTINDKNLDFREKERTIKNIMNSI